MGFIIGFLITLVVTAIALIIISKLPLGVEIDDFSKALVSALVFGVLNGLAYPLKAILTAGPLELLFFPILILINILVFGLTAKLVEGFRLRSIWSAVFGALLLGVLNSILFKVLGGIFPVVAS
jgi:putative membrane protein